MASNNDVKERVRRHRAALRASGLRPIQLWVPDTRAPGFAREAARQSALVATADANDHSLMAFMDEALIDLEDER